jgi:hypothetical protein
MERTDDDKKRRAAVIEIMRDPRIQELKRNKIGYYYKLQDDLLRKIGNVGKTDYEMLDRYAKDINAMIAEFLPKAEGWR